MRISNYDRWLTTPPEDDPFYEAVVEAYPETFYDDNEDEFIGSQEESEMIEEARYLGLNAEETAVRIVNLKQ
jgi:hypothetical protein